MRPQSSTSAARPRQLSFFHLLTLACLLVVCAVGLSSSAAPSSTQEEREIENKIPAHLPLKVKVRNPEKVKDLKNEHWLSDLEIEVQNTGDKPIYYLRFSLVFVDVKRDSGMEIGYPLRFGRPALIDINVRATSDDIPIPSGETYTFRVPEENIKGWNWYRSKVERKSQPRKVKVQFEVLSYGDGTGFVTTGGLPVPNKTSSLIKEPSSKLTQILGKWRIPSFNKLFQVVSFVAGENPAGFFTETATPMLRESSPQTCCPGTSCQRMKLILGGNCFCEDPPTEAQLDTFSCSDLSAECGTQVSHTSDCGEGETYHTCITYSIEPCSSSMPTPTPTPTPTPALTAQCDPNTKPNETNCTCNTNVAGGPLWTCLCPSDESPADYHLYAASQGCPSGSYNDGTDCCAPLTSGTCSNSAWMVLKCGSLGESYGYDSATCRCVVESPVLVDVAGDGFRLTDPEHGLSFSERKFVVTPA